jgi:DNA-binding IclR family transcriptional regulator
MSEKLKPCPFCDVELVERGDHNSEAGWNWFQHPEGSRCIARDIRINVAWSLPIYKTDMGKLWNKRAPDPAVKTLVEAAERAAKLMESVFDFTPTALQNLRAALAPFREADAERKVEG